MMYNKSDLNEIKKKIDIATFLESRGVALKPSGSSYVGLCPVHNENSPSFHVKVDTQTYKCFGCGIGGDIFSLVQEMDNYSFPGAVQFLAQEANIELSTEEDPKFKHRQRLLTITRLTAEWFRHHYVNLEQDHPAKQNLAQRNLLDFSVLDESVGFAPAGGLLPLLIQKGFTEQEFIDAGIATRYDNGNVVEKFRNRLTWTIYNIQGQPIGFSARHIFEADTGPKYLNSPASELYNKSKALLGLSSAKREISKRQEVFIVEGQTDVMALKAVGRLNTVASCGTAFGTDHVSLLQHLSKLGRAADHFRMVFCFDGDAAGRKAALSVFSNNPGIYLQSYAVKFVSPDGGPIDPCDYRTIYGEEKLNAFIDNNQVSLVEFVLKETLEDYNMDSPEGRSQYISKAKEILSGVTDSIQIQAYLRQVARWSGVSFAELSATSSRSRHQYNAPIAGIPITEKAMFRPEGDVYELKLIAAFIQYPKEAFALLRQYGMNQSFFVTRQELFVEVLVAGEDDSFNYHDQTINFLAHTDLMVDKDDVGRSLAYLFDAYLNHMFIQETERLNVVMENAIGTSDEGDVFMNVMVAQEALKVKYRK